MEYSNYRLDQIKRAIKNYQDLCDIFMGLASDDRVRETLEEVLYSGSCNGFIFRSDKSNKDDPFLEGKRRIDMAYLLIRNPETFWFFVQNKINLFHGTNANALPTTLKYGLLSFDESVKRGISVSTGERWSRQGRSTDFISFSDILGIACDYSAINSTLENQLSFSVVLGVSLDESKSVRRCYVSSTVPEVGIKDELPIELIKAICVPSDKLKFVKKIVSNSNIKVLPMDDTEERFYYVDDCYGIFFYEDKLEKLKNDLIQGRSKKVFKIDEIKTLLFGRVLENIKAKLEDAGLINNDEKGPRL